VESPRIGTRSSRSGLGVVVLAAAPALHAQQVFPTGVELVAVDVTVVEGQPVPPGASCVPWSCCRIAEAPARSPPASATNKVNLDERVRYSAGPRERRFAMVRWRPATLALATSLAATGSAPGADPARTISSPSGKVAVTFEVREGRPFYSVRYDGTTVIEPSAIGIRLRDGGVLGQGLEVRESSTGEADLAWTPVAGIRSPIEDRHRELRVGLGRAGGGTETLGLVFRVADDGAAFRYEIPAGESPAPVEIAGEDTEFRFPADQRAFVLSRHGFGDSYEGTYDPVRLSEIPRDTLVGLPLLVEGRGHWVALTEADLTDYAGLSLRPDPAEPRRLVAALAPLPGADGVAVRARTPLLSPWRVFLLGRRAGDLIESTLVWSLNDPSALDDTSWIQPGKATWPWWNDRVVSDPGIEGGQPSTAVMKYYIDFAARHGIPNLVVDAGWYSLEEDAWEHPEKEDVLTMEETRASFYDVKEVIRYAREKGVKVHLWVHLASLRHRVEQVLAAYAGWGASGIKLDNFGGDDQQTVNDLHHVIRVAAAHHLTVDYHGAYKPTGVCRTWPNFLTSEGVLGLEYSKGRPLPTSRHNVTIPYTRMLAGPMDYTPGAFDLDGAPGHPKYVQTTRAQQIAMYVVYFSPLQMLVDYPAAYEAAPEPFDFVLGVPTAWDETRFLDGEPGEFVVVARRRGDAWYLGAMNGESARSLAVPLAFLAPGRAYDAFVCRDGDDAGRNPQSVTCGKTRVRSTDALDARLVGSGGMAARLTPVD
jgi:alpha-glucosidase